MFDEELEQEWRRILQGHEIDKRDLEKYRGWIKYCEEHNIGEQK